jgi:predicted RNA-binding protein with PIN domain
MSGAGPEIEPRALRSAIEFAVLVAEEANRGKRSLPFPKELRAQFGVARIPTGALGRLRRAIEQDDVFRRRIAVGAVPDLVDPIGMLWLQRPVGWEAEVQALIEAHHAEEQHADLRASLRRADKRREAAERLAVRSQATLIEQQVRIDSLTAEIDLLRADVVKAHDELNESRSELVDVRNEARHARDREAALRVKLDAALAGSAVGSSGSGAGPSESIVEPPPGLDERQVAELDATARAARAVADRIDAMVALLGPSADTDASSAPQARRRPLPLPGGVIATSRTAAEFLLRSDAAVLVDGYNVAKLGWPTDTLDEQRRRLLDGLENVARRYGSDISVVFDGAEIVGAHTARRRMVRVSYSPAGVTADDVVRDEVRRLPQSRAVVVVTNDAAIIGDVRALGANVLPSNALLAAL